MADNLRHDFRLIADLIPKGASVLDLGCGDGALLAALERTKQIEARGVELDGALVRQAIARGVSAYQSDLLEGLVDYPDQSFDYVILSQTLQQMLKPLDVLQEMLRVGKHVIVVFPNFGHWRVRISHLLSGKSPRTDLFPYSWYDSPNLHFFTVDDFEELAIGQRWTVERRLFTSGENIVTTMPNLMAAFAIFLLRR
jgi:methionine biosynthesis protein MetW